MKSWRRSAVRGVIASLVVLCLQVVAGPIVFADGAGASTQTLHFDNITQSSPFANPCSGAPGTLTLTYSGVFHETINPAGDVHLTTTIQGTFVFVPTDPTQPTYTGHVESWDGLSINHQNSVSHDTLNLTGTGSDGSHLRFHMIDHASVSASGVTLTFSDAVCGG